MDLISRQAAIDALDSIGSLDTDADRKYARGIFNALPSAQPERKTGRDCTEFVKWLMDEVIDEENWELNAVANGEVICRKLKKLGLLDVEDGYYVETQQWIPCSEKPDTDRNVFIARGTPEFMTVCVGFYCYDNDRWYKDRDWFLEVLYDGLFWCEMPSLPEPYKGEQHDILRTLL